MIEKTDKLDAKSLNLTTHYMPRTRLDKILSQAADSKLIYVVAGAGYGKTRAVHHYIEKHPEDSALWIPLYDSDNMPSRFWENFTHALLASNPEHAEQLRKTTFPETLAQFYRFFETFMSIKLPSHKIYIVFDDFHLIHSEKIHTFVERCIYTKDPNFGIIIISRNEPALNIVSLASKGSIYTIAEDELRFTTAEATEFFQKQAIPFSLQNISQILEATNGWPLAINILSLIYRKRPNSINFAIDAMMQNINKFLEIEAWNAFSENVQKSLVSISLFPDLHATPLNEILNEAALREEIMQNAHGLASFIWYGSLTNELKIHPLYLEFLESKQDILSDSEKHEVYKKAAKWCIENDFYTDAMWYCAKSSQFDDMVKILVTHSFKLPRETSIHFLSIIEALDIEHQKIINPALLFLKNVFAPLLMIGAGQYEEANIRALSVIKEWEHVDAPFSAALLHATYSNLAYIDMYICTSSHKYLSHNYMQKAIKYFNPSSMPFSGATSAFVNPDVRSFACLVGAGATLDEMDDFLNDVKQTASQINKTTFSAYAGYDDLLACEYAFYKNQLDVSRKHAHNAIMRAREKKQYTIESMAESYLLRIALLDGDSALVKKILNQMRSHLDNIDYKHRNLYFDLYTGVFYALIGLPQLVPYWLIMDEKESVSEIHIPVRELIVSALYYISTKKYEHALTVLSGSYPRKPHDRFLFGEIKLVLLTAIARLRTGDPQGAVAGFKKAYDMSFQGVYEMFFIERGRELHPLVEAALKQEDCGMPAAWLKSIDRRASIFAKKATVISNSLKHITDARATTALSNRESDVLMDLFHGLSREEIAANQYLSINTVKKILQSIYVKLDAQNSVDAVRIALENKLIE